MPYSLFAKLGIGGLKPTRMCLQLADKSTKYPRGIIENLLVKVDKFVFPVDFVVLGMKEDNRIPIILGRPFLATSRALVDISEVKLKLRVGDDEVVFGVERRTHEDPFEVVDAIGVHLDHELEKIRSKEVLDVRKQPVMSINHKWTGWGSNKKVENDHAIIVYDHGLKHGISSLGGDCEVEAVSIHEISKITLKLV